jgi:hypothetical protein
MKNLHLLTCAVALAALALFNGCGGDDNNGSSSSSPAPAQGTNPPCSRASTYLEGAPPQGPPLVGETIIAGNGDTITLSSDIEYAASFGGITESGTYTYAPAGDAATLVLTPTAGAQSTISITFADCTQSSGSYAVEETGHICTFTVH